MKATKLWVAIILLGYEPFLNGNNTETSKRSLAARLNLILKLLVEYNTVVLGRNLNGRPLPDIFTTLTQSDFHPPTSPLTTLLRYLEIKELLTSLEEDRVKIQNGNLSLKPGYRLKAKSLKTAIQAIQLAFGISTPRNTASAEDESGSDS